MEEQKTRLKKVFTASKKKQLELDLAEISQQMYKRNLELADSNQALSLLRTIDSLVLESHEELEILCQKVAEAIVTHSSYPLVAILPNPPHKDYLALYGVASSFQNVPDISHYKIGLDDHSEWIATPERSIIRSVRDITNEHLAAILGDKKQKVALLRAALPIKSVVVVKLLSRDRLVGLMVIGFTQDQEAISEKDKMLLERLSEAVGIALDNKLLFEENQQVLRQLQKTNEKLKALDETKDEFISMASHQLRTPLTSVKGYVSMVLEGDAGELQPMQRKLLEQSFASSQRMVYLIADLLNLSRLRTGKFVIEAKPTNLADVIESEVDQLKVAAAGRNLTLQYKKPEDFPNLMIDETKIRQVIMNFADNAIYYTPAGGAIEIKLKQTKDSVEFTVNDNGIGIPPAEQHHLFNKFYRAKNAQKARPDGTGLGLFMAKKVIIAQGGAIVFKSVENKGSTFGFTFSKQKLKVPDHLADKKA